jgi:hypothetical protein
VLRAAVLALALLAPAVATAQPKSAASHLVGDKAVLLAAGERVVLKLGAAGVLTLVSVTPADPAAAAPPRPHAGGPLVDADDGTIALLLGGDAKAAMLKIDSGIGEAFDYRAAVLPSADAAGRGETIAVCTVLPLLASYENWPGRQVRFLLLSGFATRATNEVVCPATGATHR